MKQILAAVLLAAPFAAGTVGAPTLSYAHATSATPGQPQPMSPDQLAQSLLDADRHFAAAATARDLPSAIAPMLADGVIMPIAGGTFATGKDAVLVALRTADATSRVSWRPARAGVSADGLHGFTFGYMTIIKADGTRAPAKYMTYWARESGAWHAIAFKRGRAPSEYTASEMMPPALPSALRSPTRDASRIAALRHELMQTEGAFSDAAQRIGLGNAFAAFGSDDAVNMGGGASAAYVVGAASIAKLVGGDDMAASSVTWSADTAFVASSGDLGITFGVIHPKQIPAGATPPPGNAFFTIWRRATPTAPWKYVAE